MPKRFRMVFTRGPHLYLVFYFLIPVINCFADTTICYFSLNNEQEFKTMSDFTKQLNKKSTENIIVKEFVTEGDNGKFLDSWNLS